MIVPVYDGMATLDRCLAALAEQASLVSPYEVLVVDNGCNPGIEALVERHPRARLLRESAVGAYAARNRGIAEARGEVLAFTDADCLPAPNWIAKGLAALDDAPECGVVAGRVDIVTHTARPSAVELYECAASFRQQEYVERWHFGATANLFTRRSVVERIGGFDGRMRSLGDREWGARAFDAGYRLDYAPGAVVAHPARRSLGALIRRTVRTTGGFYDYATRAGRPVGALLRDGWVGLVSPPRFFRSDGGPPGLAWGWRERGLVAAMALCVVAVRALELVRRSLGGEARRR